MTGQPTPEQVAALETARDLARHGVPVLVAHPDRDDRGEWRPDGGHQGTGYWFPANWHKTAANPAYVDAWQPGCALIAVMGHGLDLLDVDPRNGGDATRAGLVEGGMWPTVHGAADTPSGGTHEFVRSLGVSSRDGVRPGLDVKAGVGGGGHGFAFIAPTVKLSKTTGELAAYRWTRPPDLDALDEIEGNGTALAEMIRAVHGATRHRPGSASSNAGGEEPAWVSAFTDRAIPVGQRYPRLRSLAGWLRHHGIGIDAARTLVRAAWDRCEQPPSYAMPWHDAEGLLEDIYARYPAGSPDLPPWSAVEQGQVLPPGDLALAAFNAAVAEEARRLRVRDAAARVVRQERVNALPQASLVHLDTFLAVPDEPVTYRVAKVWPVGGRVVLAAQYKAGKTTMRDNLVRALVDGEAFLGQFDVSPVEGTVVLIDNELDEAMLRRWLRDQGIRATQRVVVLPLRGRVATFDLLDDATRSDWAAKLREVGAGVVIMDCLRPVMDALGLSEDKDAGRFLVAFDALLAEAGAREAVVVHHMGHTGERSRGDTRIRDWPDVEWRLVREKGEDGDQSPDARRYFAAYGRDVDVPEGLLDYDPAARRLVLAGGSRKDAAANEIIPDLLELLAANPAGMSGRQIEAVLVSGGGHRQKDVRSALRRAAQLGEVEASDGARRAKIHRLKAQTEPSASSASPVRQRAEVECVSAPLGGAHALTPPTSSVSASATHSLSGQTTERRPPVCGACGYREDEVAHEVNCLEGAA